MMQGNAEHFGYDYSEAEHGQHEEHKLKAGMPGFVETFSSGVSNTRWGAYNMDWSAVGSGVSPSYIKLEQDNIVMFDGTNLGQRNVCALYGRGDLTNASVIPIVNGPGGGPTRVGACLVSRQYFCSGVYEIDVCFKGVYNGMTLSANAPLTGVCYSSWTFSYQSHRAGDPSGLNLNPADLQYQPQWKIGSFGSYTSEINSEIDHPEIGGGPWTGGNVNTWYDSAVHFDVVRMTWPVNVMDGRYHRWSFVWQTQTVPLPNLTDAQVKMQNNYYRIAVAGVYPQYIGYGLKKFNGVWNACLGKSVTFYLDGQYLRTSTLCTATAARLVIGFWFPTWTGTPSWSLCKATVSRVSIAPFNADGDLFENESHPAQLAPLSLTKIHRPLDAQPEELPVSTIGVDDNLPPDYLSHHRPRGPSS